MNAEIDMTDTAIAYCVDQLRRYDRDRYLIALTAPAAARDALFALFAFNLEVAKTADVVSEPMLGQIRLQWWREALDELFSAAPRRHEVVQALELAHERTPLDRDLLERILRARETDLEPEPIADMAHLIRYAEATSGALQELAVAALGGSSAAQDTARRAGTAYALARLLRAVPFHAARGRVLLPKDMLKAEALTRDDLAMPRKPDALRSVVEAIAKLAEDQVRDTRRIGRAGARPVLSALLPASLAAYDLSVLRASRFDVFRDPPASESWRRPLLLAWRGWLGRI